MLPLYEETQKNIRMFHKKSRHVSPHLHKSVEMVYVTKGTLELGVGTDLYHMEVGDFGIVFPDLIHHYQVFDTGLCKAYYMLVFPSLCGGYQDMLQKCCPKCPVIKRENLHPDVASAFQSLQRECEVKNAENKGDHGMDWEEEYHNSTSIEQAYIQIIMGRTLPLLELVDKNSVGSADIIYQTVSYVSSHFKERMTLSSMAQDLGIGKYALSRVFSGTFHCNFNQYVNEKRLEYACALLEYTDQSIIEVCFNSGFESQRTFNRVFFDRLRMTPRAYRNALV